MAQPWRFSCPLSFVFSNGKQVAKGDVDLVTKCEVGQGPAQQYTLAVYAAKEANPQISLSLNDLKSALGTRNLGTSVRYSTRRHCLVISDSSHATPSQKLDLRFKEVSDLMKVVSTFISIGIECMDDEKAETLAANSQPLPDATHRPPSPRFVFPASAMKGGRVVSPLTRKADGSTPAFALMRVPKPKGSSSQPLERPSSQASFLGVIPQLSPQTQLKPPSPSGKDTFRRPNSTTALGEPQQPLQSKPNLQNLPPRHVAVTSELVANASQHQPMRSPFFEPGRSSEKGPQAPQAPKVPVHLPASQLGQDQLMPPLARDINSISQKSSLSSKARRRLSSRKIVLKKVEAGSTLPVTTSRTSPPASSADSNPQQQKQRTGSTSDTKGVPKATKVRAARACVSCRARKVRCDVVEGAPCSNCRWGNVECVVQESHTPAGEPSGRAELKPRHDRAQSTKRKSGLESIPLPLPTQTPSLKVPSQPTHRIPHSAKHTPGLGPNVKTDKVPFPDMTRSRKRKRDLESIQPPPPARSPSPKEVPQLSERIQSSKDRTPGLLPGPRSEEVPNVRLMKRSRISESLQSSPRPALKFSSKEPSQASEPVAPSTKSVPAHQSRVVTGQATSAGIAQNRTRKPDSIPPPLPAPVALKSTPTPNVVESQAQRHLEVNLKDPGRKHKPHNTECVSLSSQPSEKDNTQEDGLSALHARTERKKVSSQKEESAMALPGQTSKNASQNQEPSAPAVSVEPSGRKSKKTSQDHGRPKMPLRRNPKRGTRSGREVLSDNTSQAQGSSPPVDTVVAPSKRRRKKPSEDQGLLVPPGRSGPIHDPQELRAATPRLESRLKTGRQGQTALPVPSEPAAEAAVKPHPEPRTVAARSQPRSKDGAKAPAFAAPTLAIPPRDWKEYGAGFEEGRKWERFSQEVKRLEERRAKFRADFGDAANNPAGAADKAAILDLTCDKFVRDVGVIINSAHGA